MDSDEATGRVNMLKAMQSQGMALLAVLPGVWMGARGLEPWRGSSHRGSFNLARPFIPGGNDATTGMTWDFIWGIQFQSYLDSFSPPPRV